MRQEEQQKLGFLLILLFPVLFWLWAVQHTEVIYAPKWYFYYLTLKATPSKPVLWGSALLGLICALILLWIFRSLNQRYFSGATFKTFLRGTRIIS